MLCHNPKYILFLTNWRHCVAEVKFTNDYECGGIVSVMWWNSSEKRQNKNMEKMSLLCFESCCDMFIGTGMGWTPWGLYLIHVLGYWFGLLLLLDYYVFIWIKIGSWKRVWKNTRKMALLVILDLESVLCLGQKYLPSWKWRRKKLSKSVICPESQHGAFYPRIQLYYG